MKEKNIFTEKDLFIFSGFAVATVVYIYSLIMGIELTYIRAITNCFSINLILFAIVRDAYANVHKDILLIREKIISGEINAVQANLVKFEKNGRKSRNIIFIVLLIFIFVLTAIQLLNNGIVGEIIGDVITFFAFILSCENTIFIHLIYLHIYKKVFGFNKE